ncbi:MAG: iron ABC transporter permease [Azospirillaceae bacterium]
MTATPGAEAAGARRSGGAATALAVYAVPLGLAALLLVAVAVGLGAGRYAIGFGDIMTIVGGWVGIGPGSAGVAETDWRVVELVRLPRLLVGALTGAGLALSGAALQGVFRNPLVGPQLIGVSSGAAFGGALAILLLLGTAALIGLAFGFGLLAMLVVYVISRQDGRSSVLMLVLAGVVISAFFSALVSLSMYLADPTDTLPAIVFWLMGSFATASFDKVWIILAAMTVFGVPLLAMRFSINVLSLGDEEAEALGVRVERTRWIALIAVTGITAASVAIAGIVGWVGLVVPHLARMLVGPDHRALLPASALLGASYMIAVDTLARTLTPAEIPLGILTAIVGAPIFAVLLRRTQNKGWN